MLNVQSTLPVPVPAESWSVVARPEPNSPWGAAGIPDPPAHPAGATDPATACVSPVSWSVKASDPVGTGLVEYGSDEPVVSACSVSAAASGPLVMTTGRLVPRIVTVTI